MKVDGFDSLAELDMDLRWSWNHATDEGASDGIDVYFDNVGGEMLEAALSALREHGRIIACGGISGYNEERLRPGPSNLFNIITKRLTMKGMIVSDWLDHQDEFEKEVSGYFRAGKLKHKETVAEGQVKYGPIYGCY